MKKYKILFLNKKIQKKNLIQNIFFISRGLGIIAPPPFFYTEFHYMKNIFNSVNICLKSVIIGNIWLHTIKIR